MIIAINKLTTAAFVARRYIACVVGDNGSGLPQRVREVWSELDQIQHIKLGTSINTQIGSQIFYAISCYEGDSLNGHIVYLQDGLDSMDIPHDAEVALIIDEQKIEGLGPLGFLAGAARSKKRVAVYYK